MTHIDLAHVRRRIRAWIASYADRGWPEDTPRIILGELPSTLEVEELAELLTAEFRARVIASLHTEHHLVIEIRNAIARHLDKEGPVDLEAVAKLTFRRLDISSRRSSLPPSLILAHIADGRTDYAYRLAHELPEPEQRARALTAVAAETRESEQRGSRLRDAERAAADLAPQGRARLLVAIASANPTEHERLLAAAETAAADLKPGERARLLVAIASANPTEHERLLARAMAILTSLDGGVFSKVAGVRPQLWPLVIGVGAD